MKPFKRKCKKRPRNKTLTKEQKANYSRLVPVVRELVLKNEPNTDGWGKKNRLQILWSESFSRPEGFPVGRLVSDIEGQRITEHLACTILDWCAKVGLTKDTSKSIYKARHYALSSLASMERNLLNIDVKLLDDLLDKNIAMPQNSASENIDNNEKEEE